MPAAQLCLILCDPMDCSPPGSWVHGDSPGKNTGVGCHFLLHGIFPAQGSNPGLPHHGCFLYHLSHRGSSYIWYKCFLLIVSQRALAKFGAYLKIVFAILKLFVENNKLIAPRMLGFLQTSEFWPVIFLNLIYFCIALLKKAWLMIVLNVYIFDPIQC